jgi:AAA15 family ATPase/GTPase
MIKSIEIKNFKSIENLKLDLGRINVIIGANGTGKTNILEAIAMGSAASADKLDYEFLSNRIRVTSDEFMKNAFFDKKKNDIDILFKTHNKNYNYRLTTNDKDYRSWIELNRLIGKEDVKEFVQSLFLGNDNNNISKMDKLETEFIKSLRELLKKDDEAKIVLPKIINSIVKEEYSSKEIADFLIYSPEYSSLLKFEEPGQIIPLGIKGQGLFYAIKQIIKKKNKSKQLQIIKKYLHLLEWFEDFQIPDELLSNEHRIKIKDKFISSNFFDQRSSNEGFLLLLFYLILFTSNDTPKFFAIDNIETGFNPKLCRNLMSTFSMLAKDHNKQIIFTTHNPAILDGLDLNDNSQRLFVVDRNFKGATRVERIKNKPNSKMKLSELWMNGIIGGLPDNF